MNKTTGRRKRRRANAKLKNPSAVRAHQKIGGRTGQVFKKKLADRRRSVNIKENTIKNPLTKIVRFLCDTGTLTRLSTKQWRLDQDGSFIPSDMGNTLLQRGFIQLVNEKPLCEQYQAAERAFLWLAEQDGGIRQDKDGGGI